MRPVTDIVQGVGASAPIPLNHYKTPFNVGFGVVVTGTVTYTIQHTFDDVVNGATPTWFNHPSVNGLTANADGNYAFPVMAIRLNVTAGTGTTTITAIQAGGMN